MKVFRLIYSTIVCAIIFSSAADLEAQTRPLVIQRATLIDGTGRAAADAVIVMRTADFRKSASAVKFRFPMARRSSTPRARLFFRG